MNTSLLNKATASDPSPTPGYLFEEIAKMTLTSYEVNLKIIQWLMLRLNNRSSNVKWKVLLVCRHVAIKGSPQFKVTVMREHLGTIKQHLQFTGPQDPLRGDEANQRVRDAAANAIEALSSDTSSQIGQSRMVGMGSDSMNHQQQPQQSQQSQPQSNGSYSSSAGGYVNNSGKMQGIGSEPWDPNQKKQSLSSVAFNAARSVASKVVYSSGTPEQRAMAGQSNGDLSHSYASNRGSNPHSNGAQWKQTPGFNGGGGGGGGGRPAGGVWGAQGGNLGSQPPRATDATPQTLGTGGGNADGTYERQLIIDLCAPGGTKAVPPQEELDRFIKLAPSLSPELVGPNVVEQFLSDSTWQSKNKALTVATALVEADGCKVHADWLSTNAIDDLTVLAESSIKLQVITKARALVALLRGEEPEVSVPRSQPSYVASTTVVETGNVDLLGGFTDDAPVSEVTQVTDREPEQPQAPQATQSGGSLFGNLKVKSAASPLPSNAQNQGSMFGGLSVNSASSRPTESQVSQLPAQPQVQPTQPAPPPAPTVVDDPFGFADLSVSAPVQPGNSGTMNNQSQPIYQQQMGYVQQMGQPQQQMGYMQQNQQPMYQQPMQQNGQMNQQGYPMYGQQMMGQVPMNQMQYQQMMQMNQMNMNGQQRVPMTQGMMSPIRSANVSLPDMNTLSANAKANSGFDFMGSGSRSRGQSADQQEDAFSFVKDSMKAK